MKVSKTSSTKHYQDNEERLQKKAREKYQSLSKKLKEKKAIIWLSKIRKSLRKLLAKAC